MCEHDWESRNPAIRVCAICEAVECDPIPNTPITNEQSAALGFVRNHQGLLYAKYWTFPEDVYRGN
jgi:hypothetical protein